MDRNGRTQLEQAARSPSLLVGAWLGGLTGLVAIALSYVGEQLAGLPFIPFNLFDWLARTLPGSILTLTIDTNIRLVRLLNLGPTAAAAKQIEQLMGIGMVLAGSIVLGVIVALAMRGSAWPGWRLGMTLGALVFLATASVELSLRSAPLSAAAWLWLAVLTIGWVTVLGVALDGQRQLVQLGEDADAGRRAALRRMAGGGLVLAAVAWEVGRLFGEQTTPVGASQPLASQPTAAPQPEAPPTQAPPATAAAQPTAGPTATPTGTPTPAPPAVATVIANETMRERVPPAPGTRPEVTSNADFYRVDIDAFPPEVAEASWVLKVDGMFDKARSLTLKDLMAYPAVTQPVTQACISNPEGGDLIGTTYYTGARLRDVLTDLGIGPEARYLYLESADSFYETVVFEDMFDPRTLLVYGMGGETLPQEHGFPLRITIPNRYGMKQPKWIVHITATDQYKPGFWVERSWSEEARPQIISVIDAIDKDQPVDGKVPIGGIAWAGDRGISKVEVQVDGGDWAEAILRTPPLGPLTWVQWRYDWPPVSGRHIIRVRATDGAGTLQISTVADTFPNGATGYDSRVVTIS